MLKLNISTPSSTLEERAEGMATINKMAPNTHVTDFLEKLPFAVNAATIISYKLNEDVNVAKRNNSKNKLKNKAPNGNSAKAAGKTINSNPGPSAGSKPNANTTGKIANPASKETKIFIPTTVPADDVRLTSFLR